MGWSKWSRQFFFLQLLILLPPSLEIELRQFGEDSSCQCPKPNLPVDQCPHFIQASAVQDPETVLAQLQARIKKELIADLRAAIRPTLQYFFEYSEPENVNEDVGFPINNRQEGPTLPANDKTDVPNKRNPKVHHSSHSL